jgi:kumamolisin
MPTPDRVEIPGSLRTPLPEAVVSGPVDPQETVDVTVIVRRRPGAAFPTELLEQPPAERRYLTHDEHAERLGADPADLEQIEQFARDHGLEVVECSPGRRSVALRGPSSAVSNAFGVDLVRFSHPGGSHRGHQKPISVPRHLSPVVQGVLGLDDRTQARPHFIIYGGDPKFAARFTTPQISKLYDFPPGLNGQGVTVGIIELGGGYKDADLQAYFSGLGISPAPTVVSVSVDGAQNAPTGTPQSADGEVDLDIEVIGAVAPGTRIAVYFAPNTDKGFVDAITTAVHDQTNRPSILSISWGSAESNWSAQSLQAMDQAFADAATLGVTVCCASGDTGSGDGVGDGKAHVDFPASSPHVLGCGGTTLTASGTTIQSEVVWNNNSGQATGGGVSDQFPLPTWQQSAHVPPSVNPGGRVGRGVPDVAGDGDPATGYQVTVDGQTLTFGGTSAVAPLWAGLLALLNQRLGKAIGFVNPLLYGQAAGTPAFHDITVGTNAVPGTPGYSAGPGWDACTGLGTPDGAQLIQKLGG